MRRVLVVAELAMAMMLLVGGGLLVHSFVRLMNVNPGYEASNVAWFQAFRLGSARQHRSRLSRKEWLNASARCRALQVSAMRRRFQLAICCGRRR